MIDSESLATTDDGIAWLTDRIGVDPSSLSVHVRVEAADGGYVSLPLDAVANDRIHAIGVAFADYASALQASQTSTAGAARTDANADDIRADYSTDLGAPSADAMAIMSTPRVDANAGTESAATNTDAASADAMAIMSTPRVDANAGTDSAATNTDALTPDATPMTSTPPADPNAGTESAGTSTGANPTPAATATTNVRPEGWPEVVANLRNSEIPEEALSARRAEPANRLHSGGETSRADRARTSEWGVLQSPD